MNPGCRVSYVFHLFRPGHLWLQSIIDHRHSNALRSIETPDVAIDVRTSDLLYNSAALRANGVKACLPEETRQRVSEQMRGE